jgi:MoaE-MoaD fusion protein
MRVKVLFFGQLKDITGAAEDALEVSEGATLGGVFQHYAEIHPRLEQLRGSVVLARNHEFSPASTPVQDGDEVAFLPPVSGGASIYTHVIADEENGNFFALTREPIDSRGLAARLLRADDGAIVIFEGVVRNNSQGRRTRFLDYECYEAMAVKKLAEIGREIATSHHIGNIALVHRLGRLHIGEASVSVVVTAPHRKAAFDAAFEGINRLKRLVPIWKKEYFDDGEVWVEGDWDQGVPRG